MRNLFILVGLALVTACSSDLELKEFQKDAIDLSGDYEVLLTDVNKVAMNFKIVNETGKHDIYASVIRHSAMTEDEIKLIREADADPAQIFHDFFLLPMELGRGNQSEDPDRGDNISEDKGATSELIVCSRPLTYQRHVHFRYCLSAVVIKANKTMSGQLTLIYENQLSDDRGRKTISKAVPLSFQTQIVER